MGNLDLLYMYSTRRSRATDISPESRRRRRFGDAGRTYESRGLMSAVALLSDLPERGLVHGQLGAIVEALEEATALVEFSDEGRACAIVPVPMRRLADLADRCVTRGDEIDLGATQKGGSGTATPSLRIRDVLQAARGDGLLLLREVGKVAEGRMGCGKRVWSDEGSLRRSCNPTSDEPAAHTPSGASRHLPQQAGEGVRAAI
jgi:hypothetical protein